MRSAHGRSDPSALPESAASGPAAVLHDASLPEFAEAYGRDERALEALLRLHPLLALDVASEQTMAVISSIYNRPTASVEDVPVVPKSHDDAFLRPPNERVGERPCACEHLCLCVVVAQVRYGRDTSFGFVGTEYLLPDEQQRFVERGELPSVRRKCLLCTRYWQHFLYLKARTDPSFRLDQLPATAQLFGNVCTTPRAVRDEARDPDARWPRSASPVNRRDGYRESALLFVDETFSNQLPGAQQPSTCGFAWTPVVRFVSSDYEYVDDGRRIVQRGLGCDDDDDDDDGRDEEASGAGAGSARVCAPEAASLFRALPATNEASPAASLASASRA
jgi:hypothetical protein